jgi:hypothetical protein
MTNSRLLAHNMEEEGDAVLGVYHWAMGHDWKHCYQQLNHSRDALWKAMEYRAVVRRECCEEVCPKQFT